MAYDLQKMNARWAKYKLANPAVDDVFYYTFYDEALDLYFVNSLFEYLNLPKIAELTFGNTKLGAESFGKKAPLLDFMCKSVDKELLNVEIQIKDYPWMQKRISYYAARIYEHQFSEGFTYKEAKPVYTIWVYPESKRKGNKDPVQYFEHFDKKNQEPLYLSPEKEALNIIIFDLSKVQDIPEHAPLIPWRDFFMSPESQENNINTHPAIKTAYQRLKEFSQDPENFKRFEKRNYELQDMMLQEQEIEKERQKTAAEREKAAAEREKAAAADQKAEKYKRLLEQAGIKIPD